MGSYKNIRKLFVVLGITVFTVFGAHFTAFGQPIIADHNSVNAFPTIPLDRLDTVRNVFGTSWPPKILLGTRSHGSQVLFGLESVRDINPAEFDYPSIQQVTGLAGQTESGVHWTEATRLHLASFPETKVVAWAMCRTITGTLTEQEVSQYLNDMGELEAEFPEVFFVYWTDIIAEDSPNNEVDLRNNQIREFCQSNNKILFDFANITAFAPDGTLHPGTIEGGCTWCMDWCNQNQGMDCNSCLDCPHSSCFDCLRKGQAFWWLLAVLSGWEGNTSPTMNMDSGLNSISISPNPFNPRVEISFSTQENSRITVSIYDVRGLMVKRFEEISQAAGYGSVVWDGKNANGSQCPSGIYNATVQTDNGQFSRKITLLR